jgi:outer membrane protein TolC
MKKIALALVLPWLLEAQSIPELFDALKSHSQIKSDTMLVKKSEIQKEMANASLYPKIDLFASYDNYNEATGMLPVPPNTMIGMVKDPTIAQPFSTNIYKAGAKFSMPLFVKSIYSTAKKAEAMQRSAKAKKQINILKNEALIVGANANFLYLVSLKKALEGKEKSLQETKKTIQIKVDNGRSPASALYKINDSLNEISISKNNIELQKKKLISSIASLTGIYLDTPVTMKQIENYHKGSFGSLQPLQEKIKADKINMKAQKEKLYPALYAHGSYVYSKAKAYNNDKNINEEYGNVGLLLNIPLLEMNQYSSISLAKIELQSSEIELEKARDELTSEAQMLEASLPLLDNSLKLYTQSIQNKKKLLAIAKVNYNNGRLSTEEYLRYEDAVVTQEANLYKTEATKWQTLMRLAVIYANNIEEMVK